MGSVDLETEGNGRMNPSSWADVYFAYRVEFNCSHVGKYISGTKRIITWRFGFSNADRLREGRTGFGASGREHEVQLIWSVRSGKIEIQWNGNKIQNCVKKIGGKSGVPSTVDCAWKTRTGISFRILSHSEAITQVPQYDLQIEGRSFFSLPYTAELGTGDYVFNLKEFAANRARRHLGKAVTKSRHDSIAETDLQANRRYSNWNGPVDLDLPAVFYEQIGSDSSNAESAEDDISELGSVDDMSCEFKKASFAGDIVDFDQLTNELHSDMYTSTLEALRDELVSSLPETEQMMSRAIINAFSEEDEESGEEEEPAEQILLNPLDVEANALQSTFQWVKWTKDLESTADLQERKRAFMQNQLDSIVRYVKDGMVAPTAASQIVQSVAAVLELNFTSELRQNTAVVLLGLSRRVTAEEVRKSLQQYGTLEGTAIPPGHGFALCRFRSVSDVMQVCNAASKKMIVIKGRVPRVVDLNPRVRPDVSCDSESQMTEKLAEPEHQPFADSDSLDLLCPPEISGEWYFMDSKKQNSTSRHKAKKHDGRKEKGSTYRPRRASPRESPRHANATLEPQEHADSKSLAQTEATVSTSNSSVYGEYTYNMTVRVLE